MDRFGQPVIKKQADDQPGFARRRQGAVAQDRDGDLVGGQRQEFVKPGLYFLLCPMPGISPAADCPLRLGV